MGISVQNRTIIHVGAGKTGTSALQVFFAANCERLANQGVIFPSQGRVETRGQILHHFLADTDRHPCPDVFKKWSEIGKLTAPITIVSSEFLHGKMGTPGGVSFFQNVREALGNRDVKIVFYIRRHSQWLQSAYSQWVKANLLTKTFSEVMRTSNNDPLSQIDLFADVFGAENIIVRPFEDEQFHGGTLLGDFCALAGLEWDPEFKVRKKNPNPRLSLDALEFKRQANGFAQTRSDLKLLLQDLHAYSDKAGPNSTSLFHTHSILNPAEQIALERKLEPRYQDIARKYMGREDGVLFRQGLLDPAPDQSDQADPENVQEPPSTDQVMVFLMTQIYRRLQDLDKT